MDHNRSNPVAPTLRSIDSSHRPTSSTALRPSRSKTVPSILFRDELPPHDDPSLKLMTAFAGDDKDETIISPTISRYLVPATKFRLRKRRQQIVPIHEQSLRTRKSSA